MGNLSKLVAALPSGGVHRHTGTMVLVDGLLAVNVWGNVLPARYADPLYLVEGDPVLVDITGGRGQSEAVVVCKLTSQPRPATGTVTAVPAASETIKVKGEDGVTYDAEFTGSYAVGNYVYLNWAAGTPTVVGKKSETAPPPKPRADPVQVQTAPPAPPPRRRVTGKTQAPATWSGTWVSNASRWDAWAGGNQNLFQGNYGYGPLLGAWFYGTRLKALADGRRITRIQWRHGARRSVGNYNASLSAHVYTHRSSSRPGGSVSLDDGPFNIGMAPRQGARYVDLPLSFAPRLLAGGGIAIYGDPYLSLNGRKVDVQSGLLVVHWEK